MEVNNEKKYRSYRKKIWKIKLAGVPGIFICVPTGNNNTNIYNCTLNGLGHCWRPDYLIDYELVKL